MAQREYIVLRNLAPVARGGPFGFSPAAAEMGMEGIAVESQSMSEAEVSEAGQDPRTMAIAGAMPMKLIEPTENADAQPAAGATWGVDAVLATQSPFNGSGVKVAVLDTGIDPNHPAFAGVNLTRRNFTSEGDDDQHGHGTHCAGTIFGRDVSSQRIGVAPGVTEAIIGKVLGQGGGSSVSIAQAIQWAVAQGANVISMSLGIDFPGFVDQLVNVNGFDIRPATSIALQEYRANVNLFSTLAQAVRAQGAFGPGTIIVAASGNESQRPQFQIAVAPPAAGVDIAAVGALQQDANGFSIASFSNTDVDVSAPGVGVISARAGGGLIAMSGTSMATPHVAGVAALWAEKQIGINGQVNGSALSAQIIARATTSTLAAGFREEDVGTGIVQAPLN